MFDKLKRQEELNALLIRIHKLELKIESLEKQLKKQNKNTDNKGIS